MKFDAISHERYLRAVTHDDDLIRFALERMRVGASKYPASDDSASRDFLAEGYEELVDGLNRVIMHMDRPEVTHTLLLYKVVEAILEAIQGLNLLRATTP